MAIETVEKRKKLQPRREPYWHLVSTGRHIGYRRTEDGGHWIARAYDAATRSRTYHALSEIGRVPASEQFSAAAKAAGQWFRHLDRGGASEIVTVADAGREYVAHLKKKKGDKAAIDAHSRVRRFIEEDPIGSIQIQKLTRHHVEHWRERLEGTLTASPKRGPNCRSKDPAPRPKKRSGASINRDMVALRAALNLAKSRGFVTTDMAWKVALEPIENANGRRTLYLDRDQRRALLKVIPGELGAFVHALCLLPLRPGALAALRVADFDARAGTLTIQHDKAHAGRSLLLPKAAADLMRQQAKNKLPSAYLFCQWDGRQWSKDAWKKPIRGAVETLGLPDGTSAYTLRHSTITDLVTGGLDLFTVAALSGTSILMIEKNYGQLQQKRAQEALATLSL